jgi:hypothetical protein
MTPYPSGREVQAAREAGRAAARSAFGAVAEDINLNATSPFRDRTNWSVQTGTGVSVGSWERLFEIVAGDAAVHVLLGEVVEQTHSQFQEALDEAGLIVASGMDSTDGPQASLLVANTEREASEFIETHINEVHALADELHRRGHLSAGEVSAILAGATGGMTGSYPPPHGVCGPLDVTGYPMRPELPERGEEAPVGYAPQSPFPQQWAGQEHTHIPTADPWSTDPHRLDRPVPRTDGNGSGGSWKLHTQTNYNPLAAVGAAAAEALPGIARAVGPTIGRAAGRAAISKGIDWATGPHGGQDDDSSYCRYQRQEVVVPTHPERWRIAHHEAGHSLFAAANGIGIDRVEIAPDGLDGQTVPAGTADGKTVAALCAAGQAAEHFFCGHSGRERVTHGSDMQTAWNAATHYSRGTGTATVMAQARQDATLFVQTHADRIAALAQRLYEEGHVPGSELSLYLR